MCFYEIAGVTSIFNKITFTLVTYLKISTISGNCFLRFSFLNLKVQRQLMLEWVNQILILMGKIYFYIPSTSFLLIYLCNFFPF